MFIVSVTYFVSGRFGKPGQKTITTPYQDEYVALANAEMASSDEGFIKAKVLMTHPGQQAEVIARWVARQ